MEEFKNPGYEKIEKYNEHTTESISGSVKNILLEVGEDASREGLLKTPERSARAMQFLTQCYKMDSVKILNSAKFK